MHPENREYSEVYMCTLHCLMEHTNRCTTIRIIRGYQLYSVIDHCKGYIHVEIMFITIYDHTNAQVFQEMILHYFSLTLPYINSSVQF